ncbi:MAG: nickel-dependent lactate racemase [Candidatus Omnitrophota bacterium]
MKEIKFNIPYGKGSLDFSLPRSRLLGVLKNRGSRPGDIRSLLSSVFRKIPGEDEIEGLAIGKNVLIVVPDATRSAHLRQILPYLISKIGKVSRTIDIIIATGLHKKHTRGQLKELLGGSIVRKYRILQHDQNVGSLADLGSTDDGIPVILNRNLFSHDLVISIGVIEPHLYAGYSGGIKTVSIGLAGERTVNYTHGVKFLDDKMTRIGSVKGNPFQDALWKISGGINIGFSVNVVNDPDGEAVGLFAGDTKRVFAKGVKASRRIFAVEAEIQADIVICGVGFPKDINLYQASRAINYVVNTDRPVIKRGGVIIIAAELKDGIGKSPSEIRFYDKLREMLSPEDFIINTKLKGCVVGEHRAYMVAKPLIDYKIAFVNTGKHAFAHGLPFPFFKRISAALKYADSIAGQRSLIYIIPRALSTIASVRP